MDLLKALSEFVATDTKYDQDGIVKFQSRGCDHEWAYGYSTIVEQTRIRAGKAYIDLLHFGKERRDTTLIYIGPEIRVVGNTDQINRFQRFAKKHGSNMIRHSMTEHVYAANQENLDLILRRYTK